MKFEGCKCKVSMRDLVEVFMVTVPKTWSYQITLN